jgi:hypothetical protein
MKNLGSLSFENPRWQEVAAKSRQWGLLALTAEDHKVLSSTPPPEMLANNKATYYEVLGETKTEEFLDEYLALLREAVVDERLVQNGYAKLALQELESSFRYLKSLDALPKKYELLSLEDMRNQLFNNGAESQKQSRQ